MVSSERVGFFICPFVAENSSRDHNHCVVTRLPIAYIDPLRTHDHVLRVRFSVVFLKHGLCDVCVCFLGLKKGMTCQGLRLAEERTFLADFGDTVVQVS